MLGETAQKWQFVYEDFLFVSAFERASENGLYKLASTFCHVGSDPINDAIGLGGRFVLRILGRPYIRGRAESHERCTCRSNQIFNYTCCITPKRVTSLRGPFPYHYVHGQRSSASDLSLQRRTRYRSTKWHLYIKTIFCLI